MVVGVQETFDGRYALGEVLGSGGSGLVRRAHDTVLDRQVAIKLLRAGAGDDVLRTRLRTEAQLAGVLHHPGIAQIYDYGEADLPDGGGEATPYIVMQYVEGRSLWSILRERRTLPVEETLDLVAQIGTALQAAHDRGIVHRDLKPSNVLVTDSGRAVLVDFGIARTEDADPLTVTGTIVGTADYVSPEQCAGRAATARSDVYGLGMLAYECLTGHKPFHRETPVATALAHLHDEAPPLTEVPAPVAALVADMIEKDPEERPASAAQVAARARALAAAPTRAVVLPPAPTPRREAAAQVPPWRREALRSRRLQISAAAVLVTVLGAVFVAARPAASEVPDLEGMSWQEARSALSDAGIDARREWSDAPGGADRGTVLSQTPSPGAEAVDKTVVVVTVASGRTTLASGDVAGMSYQEAARLLVDRGLVPMRNDVPRPGADGNTVVTAVPTGRMKTGSEVTLNVGVPPEPVIGGGWTPRGGDGEGDDDDEGDDD